MKKNIYILPLIGLLSLTSCGDSNSVTELKGDERKAAVDSVVTAYSDGNVTLPTSKNYGITANNSESYDVSGTLSTKKVALTLSDSISLSAAAILDGDSNHSIGAKASGTGSVSAYYSDTTDSSSNTTVSASATASAQAELSDKFYNLDSAEYSYNTGSATTNEKGEQGYYCDEVSVDSAVSSFLTELGIDDLSGYKIPSLDLTADQKSEITSLLESDDGSLSTYLSAGIYTDKKDNLIVKASVKSAGALKYLSDNKTDIIASLQSVLDTFSTVSGITVSDLSVTLGSNFKMEYEFAINTKTFMPSYYTSSIDLSGSSVSITAKLGGASSAFSTTAALSVTTATVASSVNFLYGSDVSAITMSTADKKKATDGTAITSEDLSNALSEIESLGK